MPKENGINSILVIGAGPIIIGQACEFDYSGVQACKALREEGIKTILVNSNPATIMTDPDMADKIYIEPIHWRNIEKIIIKENPDAIIVTGDEGEFVGYFSTSDYRDATRRLEAHQKMASRLKRSRKVITEKAEEKDSNVDLLDLLLGDVEEEEEEVDSLSTLSFE